MTEKEKMLAGMVYEAVLDEDLKEDRLKCKDLCFAANQLPPSKIKEQSEIFASLFAKAGKDFYITTPFWCDYGYNNEEKTYFYLIGGSHGSQPRSMWRRRQKGCSQEI